MEGVLSCKWVDLRTNHYNRNGMNMAKIRSVRLESIKPGLLQLCQCIFDIKEFRIFFLQNVQHVLSCKWVDLRTNHYNRNGMNMAKIRLNLKCWTFSWKRQKFSHCVYCEYNRFLPLSSSPCIAELVLFFLQMGGFKNKPLQQEWNEYGEDSFEFEVLDVLKKKALLFLAIFGRSFP
jgi:hypothetical protein